MSKKSILSVNVNVYLQNNSIQTNVSPSLNEKKESRGDRASRYFSIVNYKKGSSASWLANPNTEARSSYENLQLSKNRLEYILQKFHNNLHLLNREKNPSSAEGESSYEKLQDLKNEIASLESRAKMYIKRADDRLKKSEKFLKNCEDFINKNYQDNYIPWNR